jgi:uncharacterized RDD family membrane protein YckC
MTRRSRLRIGAYVIDIVLLFAVLAPLGQLILRLFGRAPTTGPEIWRTVFWNFSLPCWLYFIVSARSTGGATLGKRWLGLRVSGDHGPISTGRAVGRTALLLLPWELIHVSAFGLSRQLDRLNPLQIAGLTVANLLTIIYLVVTFRTGGRRSVHDFLAGTSVDFAQPGSDAEPVATSGTPPPHPGQAHPDEEPTP